MKKSISILLTIIFAVAVFLFIITFSIGLPIYCRFFYYMQINPLGIPKSTGYDYATIKTAYDQVLDFLTMPNREFSAGVFKFSADGASHFEDCKNLFTLNVIVLTVSTVIIGTCLVLNKFKIICLKKPFGFSAAFYSAISIFAIGAILAILIAIDFDSAFVVFHHLFFPGKDNWTFSPYVDEIINALPQEFFMNCAILIGASIVLISAAIIIFEVVKRVKLKQNLTKND